MGAVSTGPSSGSTRFLLDGGEDARLPPDDRGLLYGDGVFRTVRVDAGRLCLRDDQFRTLARDAARIGLALHAAQLQRVGEDAERIVGDDSGVLRITVTRGSGPRGYRPPAVPTPRVLLAFTPTENSSPTGLHVLPGVTLRLARTRLAISPELAGIKHLGRLEQVRAAMECDASDAFDMLMRDPDGQVVCGSRSNLFAVTAGRILTPRLDRCGVDGVMRGRILALGGASLPAVEAVPLTLEALCEADEVFVTNAVFGLRSVALLHDEQGAPIRRWSAPGLVTARVIDQLCRLLES